MLFPFTRPSRSIAPMPASPTSTSGSNSLPTNSLGTVHPSVLLEPPQQGSAEEQEPPTRPDDEGVPAAGGEDDIDDSDALYGSDEDSDSLPGPSHIEISDAIQDPHPFDPSYYDQEWFIALQNRAAYPRSTDVSVSRGSPLAAAASRILVRHQRTPGASRFSTGLFSRRGEGGGGGGSSSACPSTPPMAIASGSPRVPGSPGSPRSAWRMNFTRHRRGSTVGAPLVEGEEDEGGGDTEGGIGHERNLRGTVQEPGVVLSGSSPKKWEWGLVPLQEAQGRSEITRRAEGFEMGPGGSIE